MWFRQLVNKHNGANQGQYLQTIESEEVLGTEGPDNFSQIGT